jgi:hypothetical protein
LGGAIIAWGGYALATRFRRFCKERPASQRLIDAGAWASLAGIAVHSVFDWNMHAPANAFLACIVFGLCMTSVTAAKGGVGPTTRGRSNTVARIVFVIACLQALPFLARAALVDRVMDELRRATTQARLVAIDPTQPAVEPALVAAIEHGERAARFDPASWRLAVLLGEANLHLAAVPQAIEQVDECRAKAEQWFKNARRYSAATRGFPEPLPAGGR